LYLRAPTSFSKAFKEVEEVFWETGAKAAAEAKRVARMAVFMVKK
jgi:hypothetical protein